MVHGCARSTLALEAFGGHREQTSVIQNIALEQAAWALGSLETQEFSLQEVVWGQELERRWLQEVRVQSTHGFLSTKENRQSHTGPVLNFPYRKKFPESS